MSHNKISDSIGAKSNSPAVGGRLKDFQVEWELLTSDPFILNAVQGYKLEFNEATLPPSQDRPPHTFRVCEEECIAITEELNKLAAKNVIEPTQKEVGDFVSNIFTRPKKNGGTRLILDLSDLNKHLKYQHFKMDNIHTASKLISTDSYLASVDLQDAYYSVPIHPSHRKYLKFCWKGQYWQYKALPNGLSSAPRLFTKLLKPLLAQLRQQGHTVVCYLDDTLIIGDSVEQTARAVKAVTQGLEKLGFLIHPEKSVLEPRKEILFLGFLLNTENMTLRLPEAKTQEIIDLCSGMLHVPITTIRQTAKIIGKLVAAFPAVQYGPLFYRALERDKIVALKVHRGHFDRKMSLSNEAKQELQWWIAHIADSFSAIRHPSPTIEIRTDASGQGWGATDLNTSTGGRWNEYELEFAKSSKINYLETLAAGFGLKSLCSEIYDQHILIRIDNTTAVSYINNMGGTKSPDCNRAAKEVWMWCVEHRVWITAAHLPGKLNTEADHLSRKFNDRTEWMLDKGAFASIIQKFGKPEIDLFASRLNNQVHKYVSWLPDPEAVAVDAFTLNWNRLSFYAFPPFCLITKCLQKIRDDGAEGIMIVPNWPTQAWFPLVQKLMVGEPMLLHRSESLITLPCSNTPHPLHAKLDLLCCRLCARP